MKHVAFKDLARVFEKLEQTSSSTAMIDILARFLPKLSPQEARITAYLLSGRVGPSFSAPEFGMAEKMIARAVAQAFDVPLARVTRMAVRSGDLGAVAERLATGRSARLSIIDVFQHLTQIAHTSGAGAQKSKIDKLAELLQHTSAVESKYIVRTVLGTHRIGAAEMTFLHGLSVAAGGSKQDKSALEYAYNVLSDLGEVAFRVSRSGLKSLKRISPKPGVPVRMMLASRVEDLDEVPLHLKGDMFVEYKYDGERVQIHKTANGDMRVFSRRLEEITHQYPEVIAHVRKNLNARLAIVEGEVVAIDPKTRRLLPFQVVMQRKRKLKIERYAKEVPVALFSFDILYLNGKSLLRAPLSDRKQLLAKHLKADTTASLGAFVRANDMSDVEKYFHQAISRGAEGVVIKGASTPYQAGHRGWYWIKFKKEYAEELADTFDVVVVGALYGKGSRAGSYGSLLVAAFDPKANKYYSLTKVGAGITDKLLRSLPAALKPYVIPEKHRLVETNMNMDVWFDPTMVIEISGADLTLSPVHTVARNHLKKGGIALRFPRLVRIRNDKTAEQATTVKEIWDMYKQRGRPARATKRV
ncbi:MAG: ATP-dependent DNA ligase [Vulcanimicrobiaceae bacterium]